MTVLEITQFNFVILS